MMTSARQFKAARALLGWSQEEIAKKLDVSTITIKRLEKEGAVNTRQDTVETLTKMYVSAGIEFIDNATKEGAVVLKKAKKK